METPKGRSNNGVPSEVPKKVVSTRAVRQLKVNSVAGSWNTAPPLSPSGIISSRTSSRERSPKVADRRSPRSPVPERKRPGKVGELEIQVSKLQEDLKKVKEQLVASESSKEEAESNAEKLKNQLVTISSKLEESQNKVCDLLASKESNIQGRDLVRVTLEEEFRDWTLELEAAGQKRSLDASALAAALDEIKTLKSQLEDAKKADDVESEAVECADSDLQQLKNRLAETCALLDGMRTEMEDSKASEARAQEYVKETLAQLEAAKQTMSELRSEKMKTMAAYTDSKSELEESRARIRFLEEVVTKLNAKLAETAEGGGGNRTVRRTLENEQELEGEVKSLRSEVGQLKQTLETAEARFEEEQEQRSAEVKSAYEMVDQIKLESELRMTGLESELKRAGSQIEELKSNMMDKETELQGILDENESLTLKLNQRQSVEEDGEVVGIEEVKRLREEVLDLKLRLKEKANETQNALEANEKLKSQIMKEERAEGWSVPAATAEDNSSQVVTEVDTLRAEEMEALKKLELAMEKAECSKKRAERAGEQLEAVQATMAGMEAELRRVKVQSDQWRKAAEAAASMLANGAGGEGNGGKYVERTGSMDSSSVNKGYSNSPVMSGRRVSYLDDYDEDEYELDGVKKKNGNVLRKIGGFWKKPQK